MNDFIVIIRYKNRNLQYESKNDKLELSDNENINLNVLKERAIKILVDDNWNSRFYINNSKKQKTNNI